MIENSLLTQLNTKLKDTPLIYFTREAERAIGLEDVLENYHICCLEDHYIVDQLKAKGKSVFCLEQELRMRHVDVPSSEPNSTLSLIDHPLTQEWIKKITNGKQFYALTFYPSKPVYFKIQKLGGKVLANDISLFQKFEDKISAVKVFEQNSISTPKNTIIELGKVDYADLISNLGSNLVIQFAKGHTGTSTHFVSNKSEYEELVKSFAGNEVKVSELIDGTPFTFNICINNSEYVTGALQYQITGVTSLTSGKGVTVGNDFSYASSLLENNMTLISSFQDFRASIAKMMIAEKYRGIFGVDCIEKDGKFYLIEINARQTANTPLETALTLIQAKGIPLSLIHVAEFLDIQYQETSTGIRTLQGSQIFLRSKQDSTQISHDVKNGIYRLQSDNSAKEFKYGDDGGSEIRENVIFIDEDQDKPLIFQHDGYSLKDMKEAGFVLLTQKNGNTRKKTEEIARMQFKNQIVYNEKVTPWILESLKAIEEILITM